MLNVVRAGSEQESTWFHVCVPRELYLDWNCERKLSESKPHRANLAVILRACALASTLFTLSLSLFLLSIFPSFSTREIHVLEHTIIELISYHIAPYFQNETYRTKSNTGTRHNKNFPKRHDSPRHMKNDTTPSAQSKRWREILA